MKASNSYYLRNPHIIAVGTVGCYLFVDPRGAVFSYSTSSTAAWSSLLQELMQPMDGEMLRDRLLGLKNADTEMFLSMLEKGLLLTGANQDALCERQAAILTSNQAYHLEHREPVCEHLVVAMTGSIVAGLMAPAILSLAFCGYQRQLDLILTDTALKFTTRDFFESYGIRTWVNPIERREGVHVAHVSLGASASCILVMPATANALCRLAGGACNDLLSLTVAATTAPVVLVPAMNAAMWNSAAVRRNAARLRDDGMYVVEPSLIFKATSVAQGNTMYGGPGTLWRGPLGLMQTLSAVSAHKRKPSPLQEKAPPTPHAVADGRERAHQMWPCAGFAGRQMFAR
jgi:phosphopantothenoylcysteine decarboxylase / phosphopantothenate---cysteine ligase